MLRHGWRTAAIVPELEHETKVVSTKRYALNLTWLQALTGLMERLQVRSKSLDYTELLSNNSVYRPKSLSLKQLQSKCVMGERRNC